MGVVLGFLNELQWMPLTPTGHRGGLTAGAYGAYLAFYPTGFKFGFLWGFRLNGCSASSEAIKSWLSDAVTFLMNNRLLSGLGSKKLLIAISWNDISMALSMVDLRLLACSIFLCLNVSTVTGLEI